MKRTTRKLGISKVTLRSLTHARGGLKAAPSRFAWCADPEEDPDKTNTCTCPPPPTLTCIDTKCACDPDLTFTA